MGVSIMSLILFLSHSKPFCVSGGTVDGFCRLKRLWPFVARLAPSLVEGGATADEELLFGVGDKRYLFDGAAGRALMLERVVNQLCQELDPSLDFCEVGCA